MSALSSQPTNINFLPPVGFKFSIKKTPLVNYFVQSVNMPTMTLASAQIPNPFVRFPLHGTNIDFGQLSITFKVDEDMKNYLEIYNWMIALGFPDDFEQHRAIAGALPGTGEGITSDCTLTVLNSAMNPNLDVVFIDAYPVLLSGLTFDSRDTEITYIEATATFACRKYEIRNV